MRRSLLGLFLGACIFFLQTPAETQDGPRPPLGQRAAYDGVSEISRLPLPAQATISQVLGRDDRAYRAAAVGRGFRVENARHGLHARFSAAGVEVSSENDRLTLALRAYGYGEALRPVAGAEPQAEANRIVYRRGMLSEWYVNGPLGLEQGFTLDAPPVGPREGSLTLSLTVGGTLDAQQQRAPVELEPGWHVTPVGVSREQTAVL